MEELHRVRSGSSQAQEYLCLWSLGTAIPWIYLCQFGSSLNPLFVRVEGGGV